MGHGNSINKQEKWGLVASVALVAGLAALSAAPEWFTGSAGHLPSDGRTAWLDVKSPASRGQTLAEVVNAFLVERQLDLENSSVLITYEPPRDASGYWTASVRASVLDHFPLLEEHFKLLIARQNREFVLVNAGVKYFCANGNTAGASPAGGSTAGGSTADNWGDKAKACP